VNGVIQGLFSNRSIRSVLYRARYAMGALLVVPLARYLRPEQLPAGLALSLLGQAIQAWCFASLVKNRELSMRGPYILVRNPMYLGRYFMLLGFVSLLASVWAAAAYTVLYYAYMFFRVIREERRLTRRYPVEFARYCADVRRFLPSLSRIGDPAVRFFDRRMFLENHGHWNILLTLSAYAAIYALHRFAFA
jgi:hypothetical protein